MSVENRFGTSKVATTFWSEGVGGANSGGCSSSSMCWRIRHLGSLRLPPFSACWCVCVHVFRIYRHTHTRKQVGGFVRRSTYMAHGDDNA